MAHRRNSSLVVSSAAPIPLPNTLARRADDDTAKPSATSTATTPSLSSALTATGTASLSSVTVSAVPTFSYNVSDEYAYEDCNTPRPTFANSFSNTTTMAHRTVPPPLPLSSSSSSSSISSFALSPSSSPPSSPSSPSASSHFLPSGFYNQGPLRHTPNPHRTRRSSSSLSSTSTTSPTSPFSATFGSLSGAGPAGAAGMLKKLRAWLNPTSYPPRSTVRRLHASVLARVGGFGLGAAVGGVGAQEAYLPMKSPYPYPGQTFHLPAMSRKASTRADVEKDRKLRNLPPILRRRAQLTVLALVALTLISIVTLFGSGVNLSSDALPQVRSKPGTPAPWSNDAEREAARRLTNSFRLAHVQPTADASSHDQQQHRPLPPAITLTPAEELAALISFMAALPSNALPSYVDPAQPLDPELVLDFDLRRDKARARSEVRRVVTETWRENPVVVFRSHNALSRRVVSTLEGYNLKPEPTVFDVSARVDAPILKRVLARLLATPSHAVPGLTAADPATSEGDGGVAENGHAEGEMEMPLVLVGGKVVVMDGRVVAEFSAEEGGEVQAMDEEERMDAFLASSEMRRLAVSAGARIVEKKKGRKGNKA